MSLIRLPTPNVVDRVVGYLDPSAGLRRLRARAGLMHLAGGAGGYDSGRSDKKSLQRYNPATDSAITALHPGLDRVRARSNDQLRNNPLAAGAVHTVVTSTVGSGLSVQPNIDQDLLGLTDEQADAWELNALRWWSLWSETTECDIEGELTFGEQQSLALRSVLGGGDVLRLRRFLWDSARNRPRRRGEFFGTKTQLIEADRVSNPNFSWDTNKIAGGVEVDDDGRVLAYWVKTTHPGESFVFQGQGDWTRIPARHPNSGERVAKLLLDRLRPGQRRGAPYLAPVIGSLKQLERYTDAELMAAVVAAMFTVFVKSDLPEASPLSGLNEAEETPDSTGDLYLGQGLVVDLDPGEDVQIANPGRPNASFDPFVLSVYRQIGVGLELPFEVLIKHFQSSYSASRGAILEAWKFFRGRRRFLVRQLCQPSYEDVISEVVARGLLDAPGFFDSPVIRRAWLGTIWTGDAMPQLDPLKEAAAAKLRIDTGTSTIDRESREMTGTSFLENHRQRRKETRMRQEDGLQSEVVGELSFTETNGDGESESMTLQLGGGQ